MKITPHLLTILIVLAGCSSDQIQIGHDDIAIKDVNIVDVETGDIQNYMTVIVRGNRISFIGKSEHMELPDSDNVVDGSGKFLIPGLWDMHVHLLNEPYTRQVFYPLFIANGITGVRVMAADCFEPCTEPDMTIAQHRQLQDEIRQGGLLGPRSILGSYYINGALSGESTVLKPRTREHGQELAQLLKERDVDFIKIYDELTPEAYRGLTDEARVLNLEFAGHVPLTMKASEASAAGQKSIEHGIDNLLLECSEIEEEMRARIVDMFRKQAGDFSYVSVSGINQLNLEMVEAFDPSKCQRIFEVLKRNGTWFVPTLRLLEVYYPEAGDWRDSPQIKYMPREEYDHFSSDYGPAMRKVWGPFIPKVEDQRRQILADMSRAGVGILAGSDAGEVGLIYGFSLHEELQSLQGAGLTPLEVIQTATLNAARYQDATESLGTIEEGKIADMVLLNVNPLEDIRHTRNIEAVFTDGNYLNRKALDSLLEEVETYIKNER